MSGLPLLSLLIWLPALGAAVCFLLPEGRQVRLWGTLVSLLGLALAALAWAGSYPAGGMAYEETLRWIPTFGLQYHLGLDGLSAPLVTLNALLGAVAIFGSGERAWLKGYTGLLLIAQAAIAGALLSLDLALYFVFWEAMLLPIVLLVGVYGGEPSTRTGESLNGEAFVAPAIDRARAAIKFFLYTTAGSLLMLLAIIALPFFAQHDGPPLDILALANSQIAPSAQLWLFGGFAIAFAIKMPLFPLHTWLPSLYEAAPLPALAFTTMLVKVGAYGFLRIVLPVLPDASARLATLMAVLSIASILYGGALAATAPNLVRALAYSSIAHLGFIGLGIWSLTGEGVQGAIVQMVNHGITSGALFLLAAYLLRRTGTLEFNRLGGLAGRWPVLSWLLLFATLSSLGLPGLNNFVGEFLVLLGAFEARPVYALAVLGVLLAAVYSIRYYRLIFHGPEPAEQWQGRDLRPAELWSLLPLVVLIAFIGFYPRPVLTSTGAVSRAVVERPAAIAGRAGDTVWGLLWNR